ncbi:MAG: hypothetical protein GC187_05925 [Alphaproteobacteria bacterium]|nr:hypothetical protein [Alphaproteobacteria bacterium]
MSWLMILALALYADPALAGGPDAPPFAGDKPPHEAPTLSRREAQPHQARTYRAETYRAQTYRAQTDRAEAAPYAAHAPAGAARPVRLAPDFFYGPLSGGVERPPVQVHAVRQGYVIQAARPGPVSAGEAAAARAGWAGRSHHRNPNTKRPGA